MEANEHRAPITDTGQFDYGELLNCMRCGFCLPTCPTYIETGNEAASPRGRIALMKAAADGVLSLADIEDQMNLCLGCLNCVTACPAGVQFGHLLEDAREAMANSRRPALLEKVMYNWVFPRPRMVRLVGAMLWLYQASGLRWLAHTTGLIRALPPHVRDLDRIMPKVRPPWQRKHAPVTAPAVSARTDSKFGASVANAGPSVAFFTGCVMDVVFWDANHDSIKLLADAGCTVAVIESQTCCGALHAHSGQKEAARQLARRNIAAFEAGQFDYIVNSIGGCGAALKEYAHWLKDDREWRGRAQSFVNKVRDISEMLTELRYEPPQVAVEHGGARASSHPEPRPEPQPESQSGSQPDSRRGSHSASQRDSQPSLQRSGKYRVTMQQSCHLVHGQGVRNAPMSLLRQSGADVCEMAASDRCCGSAGIYNLVQPDMSDRVLATKMEHVQATGANIIVTTNPGCQLQMRLGVHRAGLADRVQVLHLAEFFAKNLPVRSAIGEGQPVVPGRPSPD